MKNSKLAWAGLVLTGILGGCGGGGGGGGHGGGGGGAGGGPLALPPISTVPAACFSATVGAASPYSCAITASAGTLPYTWSVSGLPNGISSSPSQSTTTLTIAGVPDSQDAVGGRATTYTITLCVSDASSARVCLGTQAQPFTLTVKPAAGTLSIATQSPLPYAYVGVNYTQLISTVGGVAPYTFVLAAGSALPGGLKLSSNGQISGSPTTAGTYPFTLDVTDSSSPQQHASANFTLTVNSASTGCAANPGNSLCGLYWFGIRGFNSNSGPTALGGAFTVDSSGNFSGEVISNDSVSGYAQTAVTGGSFTMDPSGDGRGILTLNGSGGAIATLRFVLGGSATIPLEEFETSGARLGTNAAGFLIGPETAPIPAIAGNTDLAVRLLGANGANQKAGLLGLFTIGANGCDGSNGSLKSLEPLVTNTAGTVHAGLTATGSCTAPDANGIGTAQFTISGGTPYTSNTLHFTYVAAVTGGTLQAVLFLEKDALGANQPLLAAFARPNYFFGLSFGGLGPCLFAEQGTIDGTVNPHTSIASITRFSPTSGNTGTGTVSGVIDQNAAGTLTNKAAWAYTNYSVDANGVGTLSGAGHKNIHVVLSTNGFLTMDESAEVRTGRFIQQHYTALAAGGVLGNAEGAPTTSRGGGIIGVVRDTGSTAGTFTGTVDFIKGNQAFTGAALGGAYGAPNYVSIDPTTGRGTGNVSFTSGNNSGSTNIVIYAARFAVFLVLNMQSGDPDVEIVQ